MTTRLAASPLRSLARRPFLLQAAAALAVAASAGAVQAQAAGAPFDASGAQNISWRQTSVFHERVANVNVRRGVAIFANGEPALMTVRLQPTMRPVDGRMTVLNEMRFRFEDGSTFALRGQSSVPVQADGSPIPGEVSLGGEFVEGTGRFAGIAGTWRMRSRTDLSIRTDGVLGDYFGDGTATYTLGK